MAFPYLIGILYLVSETILRFTRKKPVERKVVDTRSFLLLWSTVVFGALAADTLPERFPDFAFHASPEILYGLLGVFVLGVALRWWAILTLGRFFGTGISLATNHPLITTGPYYLIRHPSYTGLLLILTAFAGTQENWLALPCALLPVIAALIYRMHIEEIALLRYFGDSYLRYQAHTYRLIPWIV